MKYTRLAFVLLSVFLAACAGDPARNTSSNAAGASASAQPTTTPTTPAPNTNVTASPAANEPSGDNGDFEGTAGVTEKQASNVKVNAILKDVRSAGHGNYDRVVFEFEGEKIPTYKIEYIDRPVRACGSGDVVPFQGDAWLSVLFTVANAHTEAGEPTIKDRTRSPNHTIVKDLKLICDFEAEVEWVLGVASPNKYRVLELKDPTRLVVDIKHNR